MARHKKFIQLFVALGLALGASNAGAAWAAGRASEDGKESVYVQLQSTKLRADTKHWAAARANLKYGDRLIVLVAKDDWLNVKSGKTSGFVHVTAVTPREVVLQRSGKNLKASADSADIVLAGKGFGKDVEKSFLAKAGSAANIGAVNAMERSRVSESQLLQFIEQGKLRKD